MSDTIPSQHIPHTATGSLIVSFDPLAPSTDDCRSRRSPPVVLPSLLLAFLPSERAEPPSIHAGGCRLSTSNEFVSLLLDG